MMERWWEKLMRDGGRDGEYKERCHIFHVERAGGQADMETKRASWSIFVSVCALMWSTWHAHLYMWKMCMMWAWKHIFVCVSICPLEKHKKTKSDTGVVSSTVGENGEYIDIALDKDERERADIQSEWAKQKMAVGREHEIEREHKGEIWLIEIT